MPITKVDVVFSINVHEKVDFLIKQLENIKEFVDLNYTIIINPNKFMYEEIQKHSYFKNKNNIILNENYLEKKRFHGSLLNGIYRNMLKAIDNYHYKCFIILSSRNMFYNKLNKINYENLAKIDNGKKYKDIKKKNWHWPKMIKTKLSDYLKNNNLFYVDCSHEGLTFEYDTTLKLKEFLEKHQNIKDDLFNYNACVEEFALQSICLNTTGYFYNIGNGVWNTPKDKISQLPKNRYVYKTNRE